MIILNLWIGRNEICIFAEAYLLEYLIRFRAVKVKAFLVLRIHENTKPCKKRENKIRKKFSENNVPSCESRKAAIKQIAPYAAACNFAAHCIQLFLGKTFFQTNEVVGFGVIISVAFNVVIKTSAAFY